ELTHVIADKDGSFTLNLPSAQTNGQTLSVTATDAAGNTSQPATITAPIVDTTPPAEPTATLSDDGTTITGQAEAGSTITVKDAQGNTLGSEKADDTGSFSIKLTAAQTNGQTLSVTATDAAGNTSQPATVLAQDTTPPEPESLIANPDTHTSTVTAVQDNLNGTNGNILQIAGLTALGIDISLLSSNNFNIKVEDNTSEDVTLNVSGSIALSLASGLAALVSNGLTADLSVIDTATGQVVQTLSDAIKISAGVVSLNYSGSVLIQGLTSGNYTVAVSSASASSQIGKLISAILKLSVGTSIKVSVTDSVQYTYGETTGNVLTSDTAGDVADTGSRIHVTSVTSDTIEGASTVSVASSGTTTITGEYGVLTISADGSYTYQPSSDTSNIGKIDVFTYTITDASGQTATANLTLTIEGTHSTAVADSVSISDTTVLATGTSLTYTTNTLVSALAISKNGSVTKTATESFTVASGTTLNDASLVLKFTAANSDTLNNSTTTVSGTLTILNVTTGVSESTTLSASLALASLTPYNSTQTISLSSLGLSELTEGNYSVSFSYSASNAPLTIFGSGGTALTVTSSLSGTSIDTTHHYTESETASGNILNGTDSDSVADTFGSQYQSFTITGNNASGTSVSYTVSGGDKSITDSSGSSVSGDTVTLYGKYGTLVLSNDGSYTYTLKAGIDTSTITAKEMFSYSLNDSDGTSSTAKLTIDLHPVITGSANADTISSTAYDDTFTTGSGADTVVYKLLADDSTGGNGSDTWTDFSTTNGDHIDVSALLVGWDKNTSSLGNYISVSHTDNTTVVSIDRDGTGSAYSSTTLVTLDAQNVTLDELIDHHTSS
ncbi:beta strand repeat-containing protein, partial [Rosenbergiella nectarea]|uniref:beta strand repeat-containing protein n=3 Tax=Rosenbergiella nectarea TaxID=988801 RepID=UPI001F4F56A4